MGLLDPLLDLFRGKAVTIPPMDGALKPNTLLDEADVVAAALAPDNLCLRDGRLIYSSGSEVRQIAPKKTLATFESPVSALAVAEDNTLAVGLDDGTLLLGDRKIAGFTCITALCFHGDGLYVCHGSADFAPSQWVSDLMHRNASGSLWKVDRATGERRKIAGGLAYPNGIVFDPTGNRLVVSESWKHRLIGVPLQGGGVTAVLSRLPGYPSRLAATPAGYLLCLFAPLNRLVEFVLQEPAYRADMMREIDSRFWIAPTLSPAHSFLEPLQNGGVRSMGVHKPWSPSRSCGLVAVLDPSFQPVSSAHSRANGRFHGMTSALQQGDTIIATSRGGNHIIRIPAGGEA
jgi:hypothetical protein